MTNPLDTQVGGNHYKGFAIQPVEYIHANNIPFIEGCIIKYASRWRDKGGIDDLKKIKHFADLLIELEQEKKENHNEDPLIYEAFIDGLWTRLIPGQLIRSDIPVRTRQPLCSDSSDGSNLCQCGCGGEQSRCSDGDGQEDHRASLCGCGR